MSSMEYIFNGRSDIGSLQLAQHKFAFVNLETAKCGILLAMSKVNHGTSRVTRRGIHRDEFAL